MHKFLLLTLLLVLAVSAFAQENTDRFTLKVRPLPEQCEDLKTTDDGNVARLGKDLATADAAGKIRLAAELGKTCHKKSTEPLLTLLQDKDPLVRVAGIDALAHLGDEEAIEPLIEIVKDPDWRVRFVVGPALCAFQKQKPSYAALNYLGVTNSSYPLDEADARARCNAFLAIEQLRDVGFSRKPYFFLFGLQNHEDAKVKAIARETLLVFKDTRNGTRELIAMLKQSINPNLRRDCAFWLGQHKAEIGRDILNQIAASDADESVRKVARESLILLGPAPVEEPDPSEKPKAATSSAKTRNVTKPAPKTRPRN
ncbi:MAG: HEAT repeat domain-containing protein [Blastocatellia bacterium]